MQLFEIGYFSKTHGVKGQLVLRTQHQFDHEALKALFVEIRGQKAPHFIQSVKASNNGMLFTLEDITTIELAKPLLNKAVFIDASLVDEPADEDDLSGYELHDAVSGVVGQIKGVEQHGAQDLFLVDHHGTEILLPAIDELIDEIDDDARIVHYRAPEGLIDMLLGR